MKSSGNLILLEKFKTYQQTSPYTCGIASLIMAVNYLDGTVLNETEMAIKAEANNETGIFIANLEKLVGELGYEYECKTNFTEEECPSLDEEKFSEYIRESLANKEPIIVISNDWGGHYSVIIGYDDMGTKDFIDDDVIILADPYDTSDHINDGYTIFSYERFYYQMAIKVFGIIISYNITIVTTPIITCNNNRFIIFQRLFNIFSKYFFISIWKFISIINIFGWRIKIITKFSYYFF